MVVGFGNFNAFLAVWRFQISNFFRTRTPVKTLADCPTVPILLVNPTSRLDLRDQGRNQYKANQGTCLRKTFVTNIFLNFSAIFTPKNNFSLNEHWI